MSIKKCVNGSFVNDCYKEYGTETDTITTLPKTIITDGQSASAVIKGNLSQSGTPTPTSPIYPSETGDKTANLCDESTLQNGYFDTATYQYNPNDNYRCFSMSLSAGTYTIFAKSDSLTIRLLRVSSASLGVNAVNLDNRAYTFTLSATETIYVSMRNSTTTNDFTGLTIMLNTGDRTLPHEPYGQYKIPILSGGVTTPVYLGEVQSTRQIEKIKLDELSWTYISTASYRGFYIYDYTTDLVEAAGGYCNKLVVHTGPFTSAPDNSITIFESSGRQRLFIRYDDAQGDTTALMAMLSGAVFYGVKTTPTTGIVNEPIRKIGTYADSVSVSNIPTTGTAEQFDVDTTLKPSEVQLTYHGWHERSDTKYTE